MLVLPLQDPTVLAVPPTCEPYLRPPLPRSVVSSSIVDRLLPPELTEVQLTKARDSEGENKDEDKTNEWMLRFDGTCQSNPRPGGAGAALVTLSDPVVWTCSHNMPSSRGTNSTEEYISLLLLQPGFRRPRGRAPADRR